MSQLPARLALLALITLGLLLPASASAAPPAPAAKAARTCPAQGLLPSRANVVAVRRAVLCLLNVERARRGLRALKSSRTLRRVATAHSSDMAARRYFQHTTPAGRTMADRILGSGYARRAGAWSIGENIAWGSGTLSTPRNIMRSWMASPGHRANILRARFREVGIGIVLATPRGGAGATYTTNFGFRS